jgi:2-C-methyl-D-erythritol 2,4-cyclodiphosphate synthase
VPELRPGLGFDVHARADGRDLVLAGVRFDGEPGLLAHSDGDVVCHAVADALLGAAALGDIGQHFPDSSAETEGLGGLELLARTVAMLDSPPGSCDVTVIAERPAIEPRREEMRAKLASALGVDLSAVSVKATRPEGLALAGDGVGCLALVTIARP